MSLESENTSDFERQNTIGKAMNTAPAIEENDVTHEKMMEFEPLLEVPGERNLRSINLTHGECPCNCLATVVAVDRGKRDEISRVDGTNIGINTCH